MLHAIWFRHSTSRSWEMFTNLPSNTPSHLTVIRGHYLPNRLEGDMFCQWLKAYRGISGVEYRAFEDGVNPNAGVTE